VRAETKQESSCIIIVPNADRGLAEGEASPHAEGFIGEPSSGTGDGILNVSNADKEWRRRRNSRSLDRPAGGSLSLERRVRPQVQQPKYCILRSD
jgi:hypothetical protein